MQILLTAFEPFGGENTNSTMELISHLPDNIHGIDLTKIILPVTFNGAQKKIQKIISDTDYDYIICLGQNGAADKLSVERVAINIMDARIKDNDGYKPVDIPIVPRGSAAYFSTLPVKDMVRACLNAGVPAQISNTAGTFVCNQVMYLALHYTKSTHAKAGFIHIPRTPFKAKSESPYMEAFIAANGISAMFEALKK